MNKAEFVAAVADAAELSKADAAGAVDAVMKLSRKPSRKATPLRSLVLVPSLYVNALLVKAVTRKPVRPSKSRLRKILHSKLVKPLRML